MKKLLSVLTAGCICSLIACNSGSSSQDSTDSAKNVNDSAMSNNTFDSTKDSSKITKTIDTLSKSDANWVVDVANAGMTEVELSKVAKDKATSDRLKNFADMMITDHTKANDQLKQIAATKSITLPANLNDDSQKKLDALNKKTGKDFDKAYTDDMLEGHRKAVSKFEDGSKNLKDADLKNFATQTLPTLQMHQDSIKAIAGKK